jgi:N-formylglutamate deformylase
MKPGWTIDQAGHGSSPLIIHVPHAATWIPSVERDVLLLDDVELEHELKVMTDWYTDRLAQDALVQAGVPAVIFTNRASRLVIDPERFTGDTEMMLEVGMGPVYLSTSDKRPLRAPDPARDLRLHDQWFHPYAVAFTALVDKALAEHGRAVIVDLHSFPSVVLPYELDQSAARPGICIGTDLFHTSPALRQLAFEAFQGIPGEVGENTPFAGTYVPLVHLGSAQEVNSVMIEIRRDLYQQEPGGPVHEGYKMVVGRLAEFLDAFCKAEGLLPQAG